MGRIAAIALPSATLLPAAEVAAKTPAEWIGPATQIESLHSNLVLPGIIDSHIHPSGIVDLDVCDLASEATQWVCSEFSTVRLIKVT